MVAIFFPRRLAMAAYVAVNSGDRLAVCAAWFSAHRSQAEPCLEMCPCRTVRSEPRTVGVSPAQLASLRALGNRVMSPTVRGSDLTVRHGHISKQGSAWLRWVLCEAAQTAKRHPDFATTYQAIARRRGKKIATTAIARRLLTRAYHLLTDAASGVTPTSREGSPAPGELANSHEPATPRSMT